MSEACQPPDGEAQVDGLRVVYREGFAPPASVSALTCAAFVPPLKVARALDLGTGTGVQALRMARHAEHVVATDISEGALELARANARLNGVTNLELRHGDWLEPVAGERFGLVVCNAPYVISPDTTVLYRDSGREDDGLSRALLSALPGLLEDGGYGVLQGNWTHRESERWWSPIAAGFTGCDAWLCRMRTRTAREYATTWADDEPARRRWLESYRRSGIEAITGAMVVLRRRRAPAHWRLAVTMRDRPAGLGERLPALAAVHDRDLARTPVRRAPGLEVERDVLHLAASFEVRRPVSPEIAAAVLALDGMTPAPELASLVKLGFLECADRALR